MNIKVKTIPEDKLSALQRAHLQVAREIAGNVPVYPASIHDSVRIIGAYKLVSHEIFITPERLNKLRFTTNTAIHETAHAISRANDGTPQHEKAISELSSRVAKDASAGRFDRLLGSAKW